MSKTAQKGYHIAKLKGIFVALIFSQIHKMRTAIIASLLLSVSVAIHADNFTLSSPEITNGSTMDQLFEFNGFGCKGDNKSPVLEWKNAPKGASQVRIDYGFAGWGGVCPPEGDKPHKYIFTVHALKTQKIVLPKDATAALAGYMINANSIAKASFTAYYGR